MKTYKSQYSESSVVDMLNFHFMGYSSRRIAEAVIGRRSAKSTVNDIIKAFDGGRLVLDKYKLCLILLRKRD